MVSSFLGSSGSDVSNTQNNSFKGDLDYFISKIDKNGKQEWQHSFGGSGNVILRHQIKSNLLKANYRSYGTPISISSNFIYRQDLDNNIGYNYTISGINFTIFFH